MPGFLHDAFDDLREIRATQTVVLDTLIETLRGAELTQFLLPARRIGGRLRAGPIRPASGSAPTPPAIGDEFARVDRSRRSDDAIATALPR